MTDKYLAGEPLVSDGKDGYMLSLRQSVFLVIVEDEHTKPAIAIQSLATEIARAWGLGHLRLTNADGLRPKVGTAAEMLTEILIAWLKGKFEPKDAETTIRIQDLAERAGRDAADAMDLFYRMARYRPQSKPQ
jgi:hypothetical protein